ncbi:alpha/beta fold hydrolase [Kitasatospora sp. NPDC096147]|uniref:alpha/beta fold hydrolase n=1 Tax=Kitasatospora sp. NPDC096147 TaxID=3364093 RepID=UPI00382701B8
MGLGGAWRRLGQRKWWAAGAALVVLAGGGAAVAVGGGDEVAVRQEAQRLEMPESPGSAERVTIDTSFFTAGGSGPRPAVLLAHGFGGSKDGLREQAERLARQGYAVLTWSARGFGESTGRIGLDAPDREIADIGRLVDWLGQRPEVQQDGPGDPRVGISGASYGGGAALLGAAYDRRIDAVASQVTWWNLNEALFPQGTKGSGDGGPQGTKGSGEGGPQSADGAAGGEDGVFKKLWAGIFFTTGSAGGLTAAQGQGSSTPQDGPVGCGKFSDELCAMYDRVATSGRGDAESVKLLDRSSPSSVADRLRVPTLVVQGQQDSLFPLDQGDKIAKAVAANGAPVAVDWFAGGHDGGTEGSERVEQRITDWFDRYLKQDQGVDTGPAFRVTRTGGLDSTGFQAVLRGAEADAYPGLGGTASRSIELTGREQAVANPPGGAPPNISALPGIGGALGSLSSAAGGTGGLSLAIDFPGQYAAFDSAPLDSTLRVTGAPTVQVRVQADRPDAVLFAKLYDVGPDGGQLLPQQLAAPLRVTGAEQGRTVTVQLPAVEHEFAAGHRLRLVLASSDLGYATPNEPATYRISVAGPLTAPTVEGLRTEAAPLPSRVWVLPLIAVLAAVLLLVPYRRLRRSGAPAFDPALAGVPLVIEGLSKRYHGAADRYAVRELGFRVERGQVLGLLGPNGAGKTTTLRMLMGLIRPDEGGIRLFGHAVRPGAPVLSRVGAFVEGSGFLPHLTGRANLKLYWQATGRPEQDAHLEEALAIADLGEALDRAVRTYSQGMRQRLAIAQAMLGLPELLILDEPTNGLDPPQIREMREVMIRYAAAGRTVIVSSHLLSEVEQSCTHLVVMDRGRLVTAGPVAEIVGAGEVLLVATPMVSAAAKVAELPGVASAEETEQGLLVRLDGLTVGELVVELVRLGIPVEGVGPYRRLEDAFLALIGGGAA